MATDESCRTCEHCKIQGDHETAKEGRCHGTFPTADLNTQAAVWPKVPLDCHCGEWKRKRPTT